MGIFDKFKIKKSAVDQDQGKKDKKGRVNEANPAEKKPLEQQEKVSAKPASKSEEIKGKGLEAYRVLIKPLVTEKASSAGILNKYVFAINPRMNKVEVKKAVRAIYNVDPVKVNISNFSGKQVRYGRTSGQTKSWKKAVVTLKAGDKIEVYEGV